MKINIKIEKGKHGGALHCHLSAGVMPTRDISMESLYPCLSFLSRCSMHENMHIRQMQILKFS